MTKFLELSKYLVSYLKHVSDQLSIPAAILMQVTWWRESRFNLPLIESLSNNRSFWRTENSIIYHWTRIMIDVHLFKENY